MIRIYRTIRVTHRNGRERVWAIAGPDGAVLVYTIGYPSLQLIEDCEHVLSYNVGTIRPDAACSGQYWPATMATVQSAPDGP
jgi:hypothetical protein